MGRVLKSPKMLSRGEREDDRDRSQYQKQYYEAHRSELSDRRKSRYREDPEYRETILRQVRAYRKEKRAERERRRAAGELPPPRSTGPREPLKVELDGVNTVAYTVSRVAQEIQRSKNTINYWTRVGLLPQTPFRSSRGDRLYTEGMVFVMKLAIGKRSRVSAGDKAFTKEIINGWIALGVPVAG